MVALQLQMQSESVVELAHDIGRHVPKDCPKPFDRDGHVWQVKRRSRLIKAGIEKSLGGGKVCQSDADQSFGNKRVPACKIAQVIRNKNRLRELPTHWDMRS